MIIRIKEVKALENYILLVTFDNGKIVEYNIREDIDTLSRYSDLLSIHGLWKQVQLDESRTCVYWNDYIDLPSDTIYEYGKEKAVL